MIELEDRQFELLESADEDADGLLMGYRTPVNVRMFDPDTTEQRNTVEPRPMEDGVAFGRNLRSGRLYNIGLDAQSWTPAIDAKYYGDNPGELPVNEVLNICEEIETAWAADRIRLVPGAVQVLRWRVGGRTRRVYGRAGRCTPNMAAYHTGTIPVTADFQAEDDLVYSDQRRVTSIGIVPPPSAFTTWPITWPLLWQKPQSGNTRSLVVGGTRATWPTFTLKGPSAQPSIVIAGYGELKLNVNLLYDQTLYIDTRPWNRGIRRENGANYADALDTRATPLPLLRFPPGSYSVALKGTDPTGTSSLVVEYRDAYSSI